MNTKVFDIDYGGEYKSGRNLMEFKDGMLYAWSPADSSIHTRNVEFQLKHSKEHPIQMESDTGDKPLNLHIKCETTDANRPMTLQIPVNTAAQMQCRDDVHEWLSKTRKTVENFMKSREEAEIKHSLEAQAKKLKRLSFKPLSQYSQPRPQPEKLCSCPLNCDTKFSLEQKKSLHEQFCNKFSHFQQNVFIQRHLKIRSQGLEDKGKRNTCIYIAPTIGSAKESNRHARTLNYDTVMRFLDTSVTHRNGFRPNVDIIKNRPDTGNDSPKHESTSEHTVCSATVPKIIGARDSSPLDSQAENGSNVNAANSPASSNDNDAASVKSADAETDNVWDFSDDDDSAIDYSSRVRYVGVCQKAFMNMFGITEKRIRWQREKLLQKLEIKLQVLAEERLEEAKERRKQAEEKNRMLSVARSLGAGCKPLFDLMTKTNCDRMFPQLLLAIVDDVSLVDDFFRNQLWKLEDMMDVSVDLASLFSIETETDQPKL